MNMDVFVFGIGCSGTTMTYSLLQSIFARQFADNYYSTYEPFIWNREKFNLPYKKAGGLFGKTSSLSVEGIYIHVNTPMFIDSANSEEYMENGFFRHFSPAAGPGIPHLAKFIRGNGRMSLFRAINPAARMLLIIRNPVDNVNCSKHKFSFYGEDFYPSDFPRFCQQLGLDHKLTLDEQNASWAQKQAEYCFQMNRAAIDFAIRDSNTFILEYDSFIRNLATSVSDLCDFLEVPFSDDHVNELQKPTGSVTGSNVLSQAEYETILGYDALYSELCEKAKVTRGKCRAEIQGEYDGKCQAEDIDFEFQQQTTNRLRWTIRARDKQIRQLEEQLRQSR